jgi:hypothetical protein
MGAIGGLLAAERHSESNAPDWTQTVAMAQAALFASALSLIVALALFAVLGSEVENIATKFR